jgi:hypothetical protein
MAWFTEVKSDRRFVVTDSEHPYYNCIVAIYDIGRSFTSVAPIGENGFCDHPIAVFEDQIEEF